MAATVLFISPCVASSTALISLCDVLPGPKYMLEHPGPGGTDTLGFLSSVRTTARLNLISKRVFPLPLALKTQGQRGQSATAEARRSHDERMDAHTVQYVRETSRLTWPSAGGPPTLEVSSAGASASGSSTFLPTRTAVDVASLQDEVLAAHPNLKDGIKDLLGTSPQLAVHGPPETAAVQAWKPPPPPDQPPLATPLGGTNKRAAEDLKARLKRPRPPPPPSEPHPGSNNVPNVQNQSSVAVGTLATQQPPVQQDDYPQVTFLGTGSAEPSKYRGASAILLRVAPRGAALLDCGEGAWGQLVRLHGVEGAGALVAGLGCLWVSHRHADHMAGVLQILMQYPRTAPPLLVIGPRSLQHWLSEAAPVLSAPAYTFVHCSELHNGSHWAHAALHGSLGIASTACVSMRHCSDAFGVVMRHQSGWSIVYSGDTQPCDNLVRAGQGATLLIHEATFEPALVGEARKKRHSTTTEAMDVARRMGAYRTVLTHFSQRYPKCPEGVLEECQRGGSSFAVAFDGMCVPLSLLEHLPKVTLLAAMALEQTSNQAEDAGRT